MKNVSKNLDTSNKKNNKGDDISHFNSDKPIVKILGENQYNKNEVRIENENNIGNNKPLEQKPTNILDDFVARQFKNQKLDKKKKKKFIDILKNES